MTIFKKTPMLAILILILSGCMSPPKQHPIYEPIEIVEIIEIPNEEKEDIYNKARQWFSQYFVSGESVIDYEDKKEGVIIGNGISNNGSNSQMGMVISKFSFEYTIRIDTKDNKFKTTITVTNHKYTIQGKTYTNKNVNPTLIESSKKEAKLITKKIKEYIQKKNQEKEEW